MGKRKKKIDQAVDYSLLKRIFKEVVKPQLRLIITAIILMALSAAGEGYTITLLKKVLDEGFIGKNMETLNQIGIFLVSAYILKNILLYFGKITMSIAGMRAGIDLRRRIVAHIIKLDLDYINKSSIGRLLNHINVEAGAVLSIATGTLAKAIRSLITCIIMVGIMAYYGRQMFFVLIFLVPTIGISVKLIVSQIRKATKKLFDIRNQHSSLMLQVMNGLKTVKSYVREDHETERIYQFERKLYKHGVKRVKVDEAQTPIMETFIGFGLAISLWTGGYLISNGMMTVGDFVAFLISMTAAYKPLKSLLNINTAVQNGLIGAERVYKFLDTKKEITQSVNAKLFDSSKADFNFKSVNFSYEKDEGKVINNLSFSVKTGTVCAFVGPSGSGKSTIMNLISRFYNLDSGHIEINGVNLEDYELNSLREHIAFVHQDVFLFDGSVADNIRYGKLDATDEEIIRAAKLAACYDFITNELPGGFETRVGEKGVRLSGGQKQRISIARALLKDAPILLLDEATSALDTESEKQIQEALNTLMEGRTTFVIAHRLSTILHADKICVIKDGKLEEEGSHQELLKKKGLYKKLYDIQFN